MSKVLSPKLHYGSNYIFNTKFVYRVIDEMWTQNETMGHDSWPQLYTVSCIPFFTSFWVQLFKDT